MTKVTEICGALAFSDIGIFFQEREEIETISSGI
jgi:hypothetical protein